MPLWLTHTNSGPLSQALLHHRSVTSNSTHSLPSALLQYKSCLFCSSLWPLGIWLWYWSFKSFFSWRLFEAERWFKERGNRSLCALLVACQELGYFSAEASQCLCYCQQVFCKLLGNCSESQGTKAPGPTWWSGLWPWLCQFFGDDGQAFKTEQESLPPCGRLQWKLSPKVCILSPSP